MPCGSCGKKTVTTRTKSGTSTKQLNATGDVVYSSSGKKFRVYRPKKR